MSEILELASNLIARESVTPEDAGCQAMLSERLQAKGFHCEQLDFADVKNLFVTHGVDGPVMIFLGHTDVVPPGPRDQWLSDPFTVMPIQMFNWISRPQSEFHVNAAATGIILLIMTLAMNAVAIYIRYRFRKKIKW